MTNSNVAVVTLPDEYTVPIPNEPDIIKQAIKVPTLKWTDKVILHYYTLITVRRCKHCGLTQNIWSGMFHARIFNSRTQKETSMPVQQLREIFDTHVGKDAPLPRLALKANSYMEEADFCASCLPREFGDSESQTPCLPTTIMQVAPELEAKRDTPPRQPTQPTVAPMSDEDFFGQFDA